jgi:tetratricopeptide (TPR) repeat protein
MNKAVGGLLIRSQNRCISSNYSSSNTLVRLCSLNARPKLVNLKIPPSATFSRGFQRIPVTSDRGKRLLRYSRVVLASIAVFYGMSLGYPLAVVTYYSYKMDHIQKIPDSWPTKIRLLAWGAVGQEQEENYVLALRYYKSVIEELEKLEGSDVDLMDKPKAWLAGYADIKIRIGLIQDMFGKDEDAKQALLEGYIYGAGDNGLKSQAAIALSRMAVEEGLVDDAENLLKEAIRWVVPESIGIKFEDPSWCPVVPENLRISEPQILAFMALGKFYAQGKRDLKQALTIFLSTQRAIQNYKVVIEASGAQRRRPQYDDPKCMNAQLQSHISEVLWAMKIPKDSIVWGEEAYQEAHNKSNKTVECGICAKATAMNLAKMYGKLGLQQSSDRFKHLAAEQKVLLFNASKSEKFRSHFW